MRIGTEQETERERLFFLFVCLFSYKCTRTDFYLELRSSLPGLGCRKHTSLRSFSFPLIIFPHTDSHSLASFWFIWLSFSGSSQQEEPWSQTEGLKPGVLGEPSGPWGWAERWGTDTVVCDKRVSFIANDSHRGDQLLGLRRLTHVHRPCRTDSTAQSSSKIKKIVSHI